MKEYNVTYFIKANNTETKYEMVVATTAAYACKRLKELVKINTSETHLDHTLC